MGPSPQFHGQRTARLAAFAVLLALCLVAGAGPQVSGAQSGDVPDGPAAQVRKPRVMRTVFDDYEGRPMSFPSCVYVEERSGEVYVVDGGNARILVYTHDLYPLLTIGASDGLESPTGVAVDGRGYVYVAQVPGPHYSRSRITVLNPALSWERDLVFTGFAGAEQFRPRHLAVGEDGSLYVAGDGYDGVVVLDAEGDFLREVAVVDALGEGEPHRAAVNDVELDAQGRLFVLSEEMGRVYVFDRAGEPAGRFGEKGGGPGKLSRPRGMALDEQTGTVFVVDYMRHAVNAYSSQGDYLYEFGGKGWRDGWFQFPSDVGVDAAGDVLVADTFNNRVQVLRPQ